MTIAAKLYFWGSCMYMNSNALKLQRGPGMGGGGGGGGGTQM